jgi:septum site-determining protein MinC
MAATSRSDPTDARQDVSSTIDAPAIEIKGSVFTLTVLRILRADLRAIEYALKQRLSVGPHFFECAPVVVDLQDLKDHSNELDFLEFAELLRQLRLVPVGVRHGTPEQLAEAGRAGFAIMKGGPLQDLPKTMNASGDDQNRVTTPQTGTGHISGRDASIGSTHNKLVHDPVRSGQQIYARDGDLILLSPVNPGAEIIADGTIHCYAPLRGRALAGVKGDTSARIFCQSMEAELVAIAGNYHVFAEKMPERVYRKAVHVYLEGERLRVVPLA